MYRLDDLSDASRVPSIILRRGARISRRKNDDIVRRVVDDYVARVLGLFYGGSLSTFDACVIDNLNIKIEITRTQSFFIIDGF